MSFPFRLSASSSFVRRLLAVCGLAMAAGLLSTCATQKPAAKKAVVTALPARPAATAPVAPAVVFPVMLGIDVLESQSYAALKGKRIGLLTHPAGSNRAGVSTIDTLRRAPGVTLLKLFALEHGLYGDKPAEAVVSDSVDARTGLPVLSLYSKVRKPTPAMLKGLDALVIDLQDIGSRSYTFVSAMRWAMEGCFEQGVEVVVLDRPNPLGGLKADGPPLDADLRSYVGAFRVPYVHGLTIGELALMAKDTPGALMIAEKDRLRGKLTVIPMRGWKRAMRWPETGLRFVPTSPKVPDFAATVGYAMVGLGCEYSGFTHGIGVQFPFRGIAFRGKPIDVVERELRALRLPGLDFRRVVGVNREGQPTTGLYVEVVDWGAWNPTELSFHLMRLACRLNPPNPFQKATSEQALLFKKHVGSAAWWQALLRDGASVDVDGFNRQWRDEAKAFHQYSSRHWLYR